MRCDEIQKGEVRRISLACLFSLPITYFTPHFKSTNSIYKFCKTSLCFSHTFFSIIHTISNSYIQQKSNPSPIHPALVPIPTHTSRPIPSVPSKHLPTSVLYFPFQAHTYTSNWPSKVNSSKYSPLLHWGYLNQKQSLYHVPN